MLYKQYGYTIRSNTTEDKLAREASRRCEKTLSLDVDIVRKFFDGSVPA